MYQELTIVGNVGGDPVMRYTQSGTAVITISVATNRRWKSADGQPQEETTWFRVTAWNKLAETAHEYLHKGSKVLIVGTVSASPWVDRDNNARASLEVRADTIRFLDSKEEGQVSHRAPRPVPAAETAIRNDVVKALTGQEPQPVIAGANEEIPF